MKARYILIKDVQSPIVLNTNLPHKPVAVRYKLFKKGKQVNGFLQMKDGKPAYVLVGGSFVIPIEAVKQVVVKEVTSGTDGKKTTQKIEKIVNGGNPTVKYLDAGILGAIAGFGVVWLAEKKGWIKIPDIKNKYIGIAIGAGLAMYTVYRFRNK